MSGPLKQLQPNTLGWVSHAAGLAVAAGLCVAVVAFVMWPLQTRARQVEKRTVMLDDLLRDGPQIRAESQRLNEELAVMEDRVEQMLDRIPETPREADFLAELSELADANNLEIVEYRPDGITSGTPHSRLAVTVFIDGTYAGVCRFLGGVTHLSRRSQVTRLSITDPDESGVQRVEIDFDIFFSSAPEGAGAAGATQNG